MNRAEVLGPDGRMDPERIARALAEPRVASAPRVTVRQWSARKQRHEVLYEGQHDWAKVASLARGQASLPEDG